MLWKFIDRPREDSLTAAVVGHLLHLPSEDFWQILSNACSSPNFPAYPGEPLRIHAWPSWNASGIANRSRVIPDLMIEFESVDLIIEAKRWNEGMQDPEQWQNELIAYVNEYGPKMRKVSMLALGGTHSHRDEPLTHKWCPPDGSESDAHEFFCTVHMCQWSSVLLACQRWQRTSQAKNASSRTLAVVRILNDLTDLFILHGIEPLRWFEDFAFSPNLLDEEADLESQHFRNLSRQFQTT